MYYFVGTHYFQTIMASGSKIENTVRTIHSFGLKRQGDEYVFTISGDGFLYNMIRIIMGTLIQVGYHKTMPNQIEAIIRSHSRDKARHTAPANGLYLMKVHY